MALLQQRRCGRAARAGCTRRRWWPMDAAAPSDAHPHALGRGVGRCGCTNVGGQAVGTAVGAAVGAAVGYVHGVR